MSAGVFAFSYPVLDDGRRLCLGDVCYRHTLEFAREHLRDVAIVARRRPVVGTDPDWPRLDECGAQLLVEAVSAQPRRRHDLQRCRYHGADGMARAVGLGVIASNLLSTAAHEERRARRAA